MINTIEQLKEGQLIPEELKRCRRWVCYNKYKRPFNAITGFPASSTDEKTWCWYDEAVAGMKKYNFAGIGFVLGDEIKGIDIDECIKNGIIAPEALEIIKDVDSYAEISPSGNGVHVYCKGKKLGKKCKNNKIDWAKQIEIYDSGRFFTVTGNVILETGVNERDSELNKVYEKYFTDNYKMEPIAATCSSEKNKETLRIGLEKDKKLNDYIKGIFDTTDESARDMALMSKLLYWTNNDIELAISKFLKTPFVEGKDEKHQKKLDRPDYLKRTAKAALQIKTAALDNERYISKGINKRKSILLEKLNELKPHEKYSYDDRGNGDLFGEVYKDIARYNSTAREWYVYNGKVWFKDLEGMAVSRFAKELKDALFIYSTSIENDSQKTSYQKHLVKLGNRSVREIMIKDARDKYHITNSDLDKDVDLLNCQNGTLNIKTFDFKKHSSTDMLSKITNVSFDPDVRSVLWERFIDDIMQEDKPKTNYLKKAIGYGITADTSLETCFILYGPQTRNGKSTLVETVMHMLGGSSGYSMQMKPESLAQKQNTDSRQASGDIARLQGTRFLNVSEPPKKMVFDSALLKTLIGRDSIVARHLHEREFEFTPVFKLFMNTNYLPLINDDTLFSSGRLNVITFDRKFSEEEQDKTLKNKLRDKENLSGILNWCLEGLKEFYKEGLTPTKSIIEATSDYRKESDKLGKFIAECLEQTDENITASSAYEVYENWCRACGYGCENQGNFFAELRSKNLMSKTGTVKGKTKPRVIKGYKFQEDWKPYIWN